jgi:uncharacterized membrane protein
VLSFIYVGIYWNNHHHMFHSTKHVSGGILWANLHLLFWLSLFPFTTGWMGENHLAPTPTAVYGFVLLMAAIRYICNAPSLPSRAATRCSRRRLGRTAKASSRPRFLAAIPLAFVSPWISSALYVLVALLWLVPDPRIERVLVKGRRNESTV